MSTVQDGGPAFPHQYIVGVNGAMVDTGATGGMALRDYFAANVPISALGMSRDHAIAVMGETPPRIENDDDPAQHMKGLLWWSTAEAKLRYIRADAMLAARKEGAK